jgi:hypothetical protein
MDKHVFEHGRDHGGVAFRIATVAFHDELALMNVKLICDDHSHRAAVG